MSIDRQIKDLAVMVYFLRMRTPRTACISVYLLYVQNDGRNHPCSLLFQLEDRLRRADKYFGLSPFDIILEPPLLNDLLTAFLVGAIAEVRPRVL
jgi:hypothetical protein